MLTLLHVLGALSCSSLLVEPDGASFKAIITTACCPARPAAPPADTALSHRGAFEALAPQPDPMAALPADPTAELKVPLSLQL